MAVLSIKNLNKDFISEIAKNTSIANVNLLYPTATEKVYPYLAISSATTPYHYNLARQITDERVIIDFALFDTTQILVQDKVEELREFMRTRGFDTYNITVVAKDTTTQKYFMQMSCRSIYNYAADSFSIIL